MEIRELQRSELDEAARLLSRGMHGNPNHIAAFGPDVVRRLGLATSLFRTMLRGLDAHGIILGAFDGGTLVGVCAMARPGECQPGLGEKSRILGNLLAHGAAGASLRLLRWARAWSRHDPRNPHWHLGPVAVDTGLRGRGIGSALMADFCRRMDQTGALSYLETDRLENLPFYEKHGFELVSQAEVLGVPNWYMSRRARPLVAGDNY